VIRLRPLLLPTEHGGWGLLVEPILVASLAAPSVAGGWLALAALGAFLARQPLRVAMDDWRHRRRVPRTSIACAIAAAYLLVAGLALLGAASWARQPFWPLALVVGPMALVTLWYDSRGESRRLIPELIGATALAAVAAATALGAGWSWPFALALWASALLRGLPAIVTVRERVRRLHGEAPTSGGPAAAHTVALATAIGLVLMHLAPPGVAVVAALLAGRGAWHLRPDAPPMPAMRLGIRELVTGLAAAIAIGIAWRSC
jgi:YwiC-like protein